MGDIGQKLDTLSSVDSSLTVSAGGTNQGSSEDLGANTSPQAVRVAAQFALTQSGTNDKADLTVRVQFSDDGTDWPDAGEGQMIYSWSAESAGDDLTRSGLVSFVPQARYFRFEYDNGNSTDSFDMDAETAEHLIQSS